jgi:hypothetical protein
VNSYITILDNGHLVKYSKFIPNTANLPDDVKAYLIKNHRCVLYGFNVLGGTIFAGRYIFAEMKQYHITFKNWSWIRLNAGTMITADISGFIPVPAPVWYKQYPEKPYTAY